MEINSALSHHLQLLEAAPLEYTETLCFEQGKDDKARSSASGNTDAPAPFTLGEGLPPVPGKLVQKIQRGDYVDMAELLRDDMELERRKASRESTLALGIQHSAKSPRGARPDLLGTVFWRLRHSRDCQAPRPYPATLGIPDHGGTGGETVRRARMAVVRCNVSTTGGHLPLN